MTRSKLSEEDLTPITRDLNTLRESAAYGQAVNDLWQVLEGYHMDQTLKSEIFGAMVVKYCDYGKPENSNAYDNLPTSISKINQL